MATSTVRRPSTGDWRGTVKDPRERKVFEALSDPSWDFRTKEGLARATGLAKSEVAEILRKYSHLVRHSPVRDQKGRELFTLRERPVAAKELVAEIRSYVTKSP